MKHSKATTFIVLTVMILGLCAYNVVAEVNEYKDEKQEIIQVFFEAMAADSMLADSVSSLFIDSVALLGIGSSMSNNPFYFEEQIQDSVLSVMELYLERSRTLPVTDTKRFVSEFVDDPLIVAYYANLIDEFSPNYPGNSYELLSSAKKRADEVIPIGIRYAVVSDFVERIDQVSEVGSPLLQYFRSEAISFDEQNNLVVPRAIFLRLLEAKIISVTSNDEIAFRFQHTNGKWFIAGVQISLADRLFSQELDSDLPQTLLEKPSVDSGLSSATDGVQLLQTSSYKTTSESYTYIVDASSSSFESSSGRNNSFTFYLNAKTPVPGRITLSPLGSDRSSSLNVASDLETYPYARTFHYIMSVSDSDGWFKSTNSEPYLSIRAQPKQGTVGSLLVGVSSVPNTSKQGTFTVAANSGIRIILDTGEYRHGIWPFRTNKGFRPKYEIRYVLDDAAPDAPGDLGIQSTTGKTVNGILYTKDSSVTVHWSPSIEYGSQYSGNSSIKAEASGIKEYHVHINGNMYGANGTSYDTKGLQLSDGKYTVQVQAWDHAGNKSELSKSVEFVLDKIAPSNPGKPTVPNANGFTNATELNWTWTSSTDKGSGMSHYQVYVYEVDENNRVIATIANGISQPSNSYRHSVVDGKMYRIEVVSYDHAGNKSNQITSDRITVFQTAEVPETVEYPFQLNGDKLTFKWGRPSGSGVNIDRYEIALTNSTTQPKQSDIINKASSVQSHVFSGIDLTKAYYGWVRVVDSLGNVGEWQRTSPYPWFTYVGPQAGSSVNDLEQTFRVDRKQDILGDTIQFAVCYAPAGTSDVSYSIIGNPLVFTFPGDGVWEWWLEIWQYKNGKQIVDSLQTTKKHQLEIQSKPVSGSFVLTKPNHASSVEITNSRNLVVNQIQFDTAGAQRVAGIYLYTFMGDQIPSIPPSNASYRELTSIRDNKVDWELPAQDGLQTVVMWVRDKTGNISSPYFESVTLDRIVPFKPESVEHQPKRFVGDENPNTMRFTWITKNPLDVLQGMEKFLVSYQYGGQDFTIPSDTIFTGERIINGERYTEAEVEVDVRLFEPNSPVVLRVTAVDRAGNESAVQTYTAYTMAVLGQLRELDAGYSIQDKSHFLSWQLTKDNQASYHVLENLEPHEEDFVVKASLNANATGTFVHGGLASRGSHEGRYFYRLVAINDSGDSRYGEMFARMIPNTAPTAPQPLSPIHIVGGQVEFSYKESMDVDGDPINYTIYVGRGENPSDFMPLSEGMEFLHNQSYAWYVVADDGYGGRTESAIARFVVDTELPEVRLDSEVQRPYSQQGSIRFMVRDEHSGVAKLRYTMIDSNTNAIIQVQDVVLNGQPQQELHVDVPLFEGQYHLHVAVYDQAGNEVAYPLNNLMIDQSAPILLGADIEDNVTNGVFPNSTGYLPISLTLSDNLSGLSRLVYKLYDGKQSYENAVSLSPTLDQVSVMIPLKVEGGQYKLDVLLEDRAGNRGATEFLGTILYDPTPPMAKIELAGLQLHGRSYFIRSLAELKLEATYSDEETGIADTAYAIYSDAVQITPWDSWSSIRGTQLTSGVSYQIALRVTNGVGNSIVVHSEEFYFDDTPPEIVEFSVPQLPISSGETVVFSAIVREEHSPLQQYRLSLGSAEDPTSLSRHIAGNEEGWIVIRTSDDRASFRVTMPEAASDIYYAQMQVENAAGCIAVSEKVPFVTDNTVAKVLVYDEGPFTMFADRLHGWWQMTGDENVVLYRYRLVLAEDHMPVTPWETTMRNNISLENAPLQAGVKYQFEVQAHFSSGEYSLSSFSPGVVIDPTPPQLEEIIAPEYATSKNFGFSWSGHDHESGIARIEVAVGSGFFQDDLTDGWVEIKGTDVLVNQTTIGKPILFETGKTYYPTIRLYNGAGLLTEKSVPPIIVDDTPPPVPNVVDQGAYINDRQPLTAHWVFSPIDEQSGNANYEWALLTHGQSLNDAEWNVAEDGNRVQLNDFTQVHGETYYFAVRVTNGAGLSTIGMSDGIIVDATAPFIPEVILLNAINLGDPSIEYEVNYITSTEGLALWIDSLDPDTDVVSYFFAWDERASVDDMERLVSEEGSILLGNLVIKENGEAVVFLGESMNEVGLISLPGYSTGVVLDTQAPSVKNVRGSVSGDVFLFDWEGVPSLSPITSYEAALVLEEAMNDFPEHWMNMELSRRAIIPVGELSDGYYRLLVRAQNQAGTYSRRTEELDEWGVSPRVILDTIPPTITRLDVERQYISLELRFFIEATDNLSGIGGYQYALGTWNNLAEFTGGWIDLPAVQGWLEGQIDTRSIPHGTEVYLYVRVKDKVGLWSDVVQSKALYVDHTPPSTPVVFAEPFTTFTDRIQGIQVESSDLESGVTHLMLGIVSEPQGEWVMDPMLQALSGGSYELGGLVLEEGGRYYLAVQALSGAGLWSEIGYSEVIKVDSLAPFVEFGHEGEIVVNRDEIPFVIPFRVNESATIEYWLRHPKGVTEIFEKTVEPGENQLLFEADEYGVYRIEVVASDEAGNKGERQIHSLRVNTPPSIMGIPEVIQITPGRLLTILVNAAEAGNEVPEDLRILADVSDSDGYLSSVKWVQRESEGSEQTGFTFQNHYIQPLDDTIYPLTLIVTDNDGGVTVQDIAIQVITTTRGTLYANEVWSGKKSILGDIYVPAHLNLTIVPGADVEVYQGPNKRNSIVVDGLLTVGGVGEQVVLRGVSEQAGSWGGLFVSGTTTIQNVLIKHAERGLTVVNGANTNVWNTVFKENSVGIHAYNSYPEIHQSTFRDNVLYGIKEDVGANPVVMECLFSGNGFDYYDQELTNISIDELNMLGTNQGNISQSTDKR